MSRKADNSVLMTEKWMIDEKIDLTKACVDANWHQATAIDNLIAQGLSRVDAEAFADFRFCLAATIRDRRPEDCVTDEQYERLS